MNTQAKWLALLGLMSSTALASPAEAHKACDGGSLPTCVNLGVMYDEGHGVEKSPTKAFELFKKACDLGLNYACDKLK